MNKILAFIVAIIMAIYLIYSIYIIQLELTNIKLILSWGYLSLLGLYGWLTILNNLNINKEVK